MKIRLPFIGRTMVASVVCILLLVIPPAAVRPGESVKDLIEQLRTPEGKTQYFGYITPGGPWFVDSAAMKKLVEQGNAVQASLLPHLKDARIRQEAALILAEVGDKNALPSLIDALPTKEKLTEEEGRSTMCLLLALRRLTGKSTGLARFGMEYHSGLRKQWLDWHESHKDYLYTPAVKPSSWGRARALVDAEAKLAEQPTSAYRKDHPWITYDEIKIWREDLAHAQKLKDYCFSLILNELWNGHGSRDSIRSLGRIRDPRALVALHKLCTLAEDIEHCHYDLLWTLQDRADPSSVAVLQKIPASKQPVEPARSNEPMRRRAIEWIQLRQKYAKDLQDKPFDSEDQGNYVRCLDQARGVDELVANLRNRDYDWVLHRYTRVAGHVDRESVRACLKQMASDETRDERAKTLVHGALARLGEKGSLDHLKRSLAHKSPAVRLAAADCLWQLGNREGHKTLLELLDLRPLETGGEGVQTGGGAIIKVTGIRGSNVDHVRAACKILGEMGDPAAIEPLKRLLDQNLNGILATGGSGTGWSGRPDVVALARLGDFSGIAVLRESVKNGDRLCATGGWEWAGDFAEIGLKRFIPDVIPMLDQHDASKRVYAALTVLTLLDRGK